MLLHRQRGDRCSDDTDGRLFYCRVVPFPSRAVYTRSIVRDRLKVQRKRGRPAEVTSGLSLPTNLLGFNIARLAHLKRARDDALFKSGVGIGLHQFGMLLLLDAQ